MGIWDTVVVQPIFNLLLAIYGLVGDFGVAVIIFTLVVKLLLWPLMKKQLHQAKLMRKLQPELAEIKKNCKGNRQLESLQMMELYKRHNVKPFASLLPLLVQLPILIVLFNVVRNALLSAESVAKYTYGFMSNLPKVAELLSNFEAWRPGLFGIDLRVAAWPISGWTAAFWMGLVVAAGVFQYVSMRQQQPNAKSKRKLKEIFKEAAEGKDTDQEEVNAIVTGQMSKMMPLLTMLIMVNMPGALVLYFVTTNFLTVLMQRRTFKEDFMELDNIADKKVLKDLEKAEEGEVIRIKAAEKGRKKK
jgi:YidC/Oxa1 family membrane protein insertase